MNEASNPYQKHQDNRPFGSAISNYSGPSVEEIVELLRGFNEHALPWQMEDSDPDWHRAVWLHSFFQQDFFKTRRKLEE